MLTVTRHPRRLFRPASTLANETWVYQLTLPLQLTPTSVGFFVNIRRGGMNMVDLEIGNDLLIADSLDHMERAPAQPINRSETRPHPRLGTPTLMARYPIAAGFVPVGALRPDGSPHPHAGTGFGVSNLIGFPLDRSGKRVADFRDRIEAMEIQQYRMTAGRFEITDSAVVPHTELFAGHRIVNRPIGHAIPDGDDLVYGMSGGPLDAPAVGAIFTRWRRVNHAWRIVECNPVSGPDGSFEPSIVRDHDGSLLMSARDPTGSIGASAGSPLEGSIRVWRSADAGRSWSQVINLPQARACTPVTIGKAADGTPYIASNPHRVTDSRGQKQRHSILHREELVLQPLTPDRRGLLAPVLVRDTNADFGQPPGGSIWCADHPIGLTLRLADKRWHHVMCYRALELNENQGAQPPTDHTGAYIEEIVTSGLGTGQWRFEA